MKTMLRGLLAGLLALWLALPSVGGEGGENAGGGGVWILPRTNYMTSTSGVSSSMPRMSFTIVNTGSDVSLVASTEIGQAVATLVEGTRGVPELLPVVGKNIIIPASVMTGLLNAGIAEADIVVVDDRMRGYRIHLTLDCGQRQIVVGIE